MTLALRLMGLWFFLHAIFQALQLSSYLFWPQPPLTGAQMRANFIGVAIGGGFGLVLLFISGRVACWFYPHVSEPDEESKGHLNVADIYRVASFLLGVYVLILAIRPASVTLVSAARGATLFSVDVAISQVETILYLPFGLLLIFGSKGIARFMSSIRYDPEKVASPRFSLRFVIVVVMVFSLFFALVRYLASIP